jgi:hypothetical protein
VFYTANPFQVFLPFCGARHNLSGLKERPGMTGNIGIHAMAIVPEQHLEMTGAATIAL